ncbi:MAG: DUF4291 domain-containing protein [Archangium sp.]|nr:DUF4291 domain-containing protein [Archangium sp.]
MHSHRIRARFDERCIVVYQAYRHEIAEAAVRAQKFVAPFSYERMTWVKPSFLWMMERCGWATKSGQERVLAIHVLRSAFDEAVRSAVPTRESVKHAAIRVQWDPERDLRGKKLEHRSLQLGLGRAVSRSYALEWVQRIEDVTPLVHRMARLRSEGEWSAAERLLPEERPYELSAARGVPSSESRPA